MKKVWYAASAILLSILIFAACAKDAGTNYESDSLKLPLTPPSYKLPSVTPVGSSFSSSAFRDNPNNPITDHGATLGRVLFYDKKMSLNNLVSCGSCHKQENAFSDVVARSEGFKGGLTPRNAPALNNPCLDKSYFWDLRTNALEDLALEPVRNHLEMGMENLDNLALKLAKVSYYPALFKNAFGTPEITKERISKGLAQFVRSIVTIHSKHDVGEKINFANFSAEETRGQLVFETVGCETCHGGTNFNGWGANISFNIGLDALSADVGAGNGAFKVPSLRNVALTAPYMHDGRFKTLEEVVEHYNSGVKNTANLAFPLREGYPNTITSANPRKLNLLPSDKAALIAYLKTLTDETFVNEERYSNPFK